MTILSSTSRVPYVGNGSVSNYSFTFKIFSDDDLLVTVRHPTTGAETTLTLTTDYTVTILANGTGSIDLVNNSQAWLTGGNLTTSWVLVIRRVVDLIQDTDIRNQGAFYPEAHENAFDYLMMATQQLKDEIDRSFKVNETDDPLTLTLPTADERANQILGFNASGQPIAVSSVGVVPTTSYTQTLLDDSTAEEARTTLGFTGASGTAATANIEDDAVTNAKLANMAALTVKVNATNASANPTDLAAANDYEVLQRIGTALVFGSYKKKYRNAVTTDSVLTTDDTILFSGASFTATLPTAVGVVGKRYALKHGGTSLTQVYTLATTSGQTIGGIASGSYALYTNSEVLEIESDGANWSIINHYAQTDWVDGGTWTITATTTSPTKPSGVSLDKIYWKREGSLVRLQGRLRFSNNTSGNNGSGDYLFALPSGLTIDTTYTGTNTTVEGWGSAFDLGGAYPQMNCEFFSSTDFARGGCIVYDSTKLRMYGLTIANFGVFGSGVGIFTSGAPCGFGFEGTLPISGWQP